MEKRTGNRFGEIAVREGFASRISVRECLEIQSKLKSFGVEPKRLGEIMVEKGYLRDSDVTAILDVQSMGGSRMESRSGVADLRPSRARKLRSSRVATSKELGQAVRNIPGYEVLELLGEGGMGMVYKARQKSLDRVVALKVLPPQAAKETAFIKRFYSEARTVAKLNHENIIAGIDVGESPGGTYYFVMEYVEGDSVAQLIEKSGPLEERFALQVTLQIARALEHAHKHGLVHRDVKPQNILVTPNKMAKLCDLGLAKLQNENVGDPTGVPVGTPHYLSPEQARGEADVDIRSDIYSLGASLFHMLTGETPFEGQSPMVLMTKHLTEVPEPPRRMNPDVSRGASELTLQMLEKDKEDRPQTPTELIEDVQQVLSGKSPGGPRSRSSRRKRKTGRSPRMGDSQRREGPSRARSGGARPARSRHHVRGGGGGETAWLMIIPAVVIAVIGAMIAMSLQGPQLGPAPTPPSHNATGESATALKAARKLHLASPGEARLQYQDIIQRFPGTHAATEAKRYLAELNGE
ncbi:MAG: serine/threonine protein kinase [Planctomycetes bacterium]|nr:serine/threonine protein kinase [Planctomycetota bacterium]